MKILKILIALVVAAGSSSIPDQKVLRSDAALDYQTVQITSFEGTPFSGHVVEYYENGELKSDVSFLNGLRQSVSKGYHPNGVLAYERLYKVGEKHGNHVGFYESGAKQFEYHFDHGVNIGTHTEWYESGQVSTLFNYENGQPFGLQQTYRSDGKLRSNYVIREDGRRYGLVGIKRCKNIDTEDEQIKPLIADAYVKP
ncbi:MAG: antitoxin component YwqK of YwqJK toxin-antitoxin module [Marinoscillum sp.]|jgi:antitoxin component YwqK of YwqJK toxin-antitoxin module